MTVKKTQQTLSTTLENTQQALDGLEHALDAGRETREAAGTETANPVGAHPVRDSDNNVGTHSVSKPVGGSPLATDEQSEGGENNTELPEGWVATKFTEVLDVQGGTQPPKSEFIFEPAEGYIRLLQIRDFGKKPIPNFVPVTAKLKTCEKTDVLIGRYGASLGRICTGMEGAYNVALAKVLSFGGIEGKYLKHFLNSENFQMPLRLLSRSAQNGFNKNDLASFDFPLPPLAEQTVIAQTLDTLLAQVENIKTRLDAIPKILKTFRQSVLAAAVSGKLTEAWRGENECGEWKQVKLSEIVEKIEAGKSLKCAERPPVGDELGIIKISAVTWGKYNEEESKTLPSPDLFIENRRVQVGDFLISRANTIELLGNPVIVHAVSKNLMLSDKVLRLVMAEEDKQWISMFLRSSKGRKAIESGSTGNQNSMRNIGQKALLNIDIPKPSAEEQTEIVRRVEELFAFADQIEQQVQNAQGRVNNLTQSILAKAFRGELTAQWRAEHPDLITGDNSAEALLAKIQAERDALKKSSKPKKKSTAKKTTRKKTDA